jgi:SAM-dependent methyltransferase
MHMRTDDHESQNETPGAVARVIELPLRGALFALTAANRGLAAAYRRAWPKLGTPWYDQRYNAPGGVDNWRWAERGIIARRLTPAGGAVLDLCGGDGMYAATFVAGTARSVDVLDRDERAIAHGRRMYGRPNVAHHAADVRTAAFPSAPYDAIFCFASLQYFTPDERDALVARVRDALAVDGVFAGSVPVYPQGGRVDPASVTAFASEADVRAMLAPHFARVELWPSDWGTRTEWYFECRA